MANNGRNGFGKYEGDCDKVWIYKLETSYSAIQNEVYCHTKKCLISPIFDINAETQSKWGSWSPSTRLMCFSAVLLRNYEWSAVEHVMRHEIAHQIVSEIFVMDCYGIAHGESWKEACKIVNIDPVRCDSHDFLSSFKGSSSSPMVEKIRKIINHANDSAATEAESDSFMRKAKELMLRHDIEMTDIMGTDRLFVTRPFGNLCKRWDASLWSLGRLLYDHYDVKYIRTFGPNYTKRLELFGEPYKLDIAEYVGHALLNQAELLYRNYQKEVFKERLSGRKDGIIYSKLSKRSFIEGVIAGYSQKLEKDSISAKERVEIQVAKEQSELRSQRYHDGDRALVPTYNKGLLSEMYGKEYPNSSFCKVLGSRGEGYGAGRLQGSKLSLSKGVNSCGNMGRLIA